MKKRFIIGTVLFGMCLVYVRMQLVGMGEGSTTPSGFAAEGENALEENIGQLPLEMVAEIDRAHKFPKLKKFLESCPHKIQTINMPGSPVALFISSLSTDGKKLATRLDNTLTIWDIETGRQLKTLANAEESTLSPDGKKVATISDGSVLISDVDSNTLLHTLNLAHAIGRIEFSRDGKIIATQSEQEPEITLWNVDSGTQLRILNQGGQDIDQVELIDGRVIALANQTILVWDINSGAQIKTINCNQAILESCVSANAQMLAYRIHDNSIMIRSIDSGLVICNLKGPALAPVAFSPDGTKLITQAITDHKAIVWDIKSQSKLCTFPSNGLYSNVNLTVLATASERFAAAAPDNNKVEVYKWLVGLESLVKRWELDKSDLFHKLEATFTNDANRPVGRIEATAQEWATFTSLPKEVQEALRLRIKQPR